MVRLNSNSDRATWWDVDRSAYEVVTRCIHDQRNPELDPVPPRGGYALFGEHNDLIVYVYNPNSDFARELMIEILENNLRADATGKCKAIDCPGPIKGKFEGPNDKDIGGGTTSSEDDDDYDDQVAMVDAPESFSDQDAAFTVHSRMMSDVGKGPLQADCKRNVLSSVHLLVINDSLLRSTMLGQKFVTAMREAATYRCKSTKRQDTRDRPVNVDFIWQT
ncbi:MAG: hypothetical protein M1827_002103 [Pycnora praestabilis]|nr:MAG: hypothetical protein M1827_002103 [Pycnora praestabilis]